MKSNEDWRNNPERRAAAQEAHARWLAAGAEAREHVERAYDALSEFKMFFREDDPLWRQLCAARSALFTAKDRLGDVGAETANECRIGNMAAFGVPVIKRSA